MRLRMNSGTESNTEVYPGDLEARLETVDLHGANLRRANLHAANLEGAFFLETHLEGANLWAAKGLTQEQIERTTGDEKTMLSRNLSAPLS